MIISGHALMGTEGRTTFPFMDRSQNITLSFGDLGLLMTSFFLINEAITGEEVMYLLYTA